MTIELQYLAFVAVLTGVIWIPYILNAIAVRGLMGVMGYPKDPAPLSSWAARMKAAHANAIENLVVFSALVLIAHLADIHTEITVLACVVYFWARVVHVAAYALSIPVLRTLAFAVGFVCQIGLAVLIIETPVAELAEAAVGVVS